MTALKDARGIEITEGASCIYGAPVGRSIALVEGVIDGFTLSGRVWVKVVRRAYGTTTWTKPRDRVHVGPDRLVIVDALPECNLPTDAEKAEESRKERIKMCRERVAHLEAGGAQSGFATQEEALTFYREWLAGLEAE
ncbi:hypothetical protein AB0F77_39590 [Streptomyces sp. NPDC026672]|uniref:hypothetical protein n=1 Tax=Actinomycetes TaxID=1760 RepID=UPI00340043B8